MATVSPEHIAAAEKDLGVKLPAGLRARLQAENGGSLAIEGETWRILPIPDPSNKRSAARTAENVVTETAAARERLADVVPKDAAVIGRNAAGGLLLVRTGTALAAVWREDGTVTSVVVDWQAKQARSSKSADSAAVRELTVALKAVGRTADSGVAIVLSVPKTPYYLKFVPVFRGVLGEAVGVGSLPTFVADEVAGRMTAELAALGWQPPKTAAGNWTRTWKESEWRPDTVARIALKTFLQAYGLDPETIVAGRTAMSFAADQ